MIWIDYPIYEIDVLRDGYFHILMAKRKDGMRYSIVCLSDLILLCPAKFDFTNANAP